VFVPTYEYQCIECGREFEVRQRISEPPLAVCEICGGAVKRLLSAAPFILKGEGWYVTDYPSESRKKAMESEKSGGTAAKKEAASPSETASPSTSTSSTSTSDSAAAPAKTPPAKTPPAKTSSSSTD
jgi:putative FmdB family regulatory protein